MYIPSNVSFPRGNEARSTGNAPFPPLHAVIRGGNTPRKPLSVPARPLWDFKSRLDETLASPLSYAHRRRSAKGLPREALSALILSVGPSPAPSLRVTAGPARRVGSAAA